MYEKPSSTQEPAAIVPMKMGSMFDGAGHDRKCNRTTQEMSGGGNGSLGFKKVKETPLALSVKSSVPVVDADTHGRLVSRPMAVRHAIANGYKIGTKAAGIVIKDTAVLVRPAGAAVVAKRVRDDDD